MNNCDVDGLRHPLWTFQGFIAAKCGPETHIFSAVHESVLQGVEIYLYGQWLDRVHEVIELSRNFPLRHALHGSVDTFRSHELIELASAFQAEIIVFHDVLWEDKWAVVRYTFAPLPTRVWLNMFRRSLKKIYRIL